ncbi:MAG: DNA polymerase IV [Phycisphaerae bacterium]|nr:MAG: DNA polymerase IV [Phycisphaerae bacterium]
MLAVMYIDMNSFFASVEQQNRPELRGKPVAVVPMVTDSTSCLAASYEAKAFGVKTGVKVGDAKRMCPGLILVQGSHDQYIRVHHDILKAADTVLPVHQVHSIDEFACRLMGTEREPARATELGQRMKRAIRTRVGECLTCSVGVAPNRFLAKVAADLQKPDGLTVLRAEDIPARLLHLKLIDFPGIGPRMNERLKRLGITTVEQMYAMSEADLGKAWGSVVGREWYYQIRGLPSHDPFEGEPPRRTIGHSHVLGPERRDEAPARAVAMRLLMKVGQRARHLGYTAQHLTLYVRYLDGGHEYGPRQGWGRRGWTSRAALGGVNDAPTLLRAFTDLWEKRPPGRLIQVAVTLHDLAPNLGGTPSLFEEQRRLDSLSKAVDSINKRYGADVVYPAAMQDARKAAPRRIAFGNIPSLDVPDVGSGDEG